MSDPGATIREALSKLSYHGLDSDDKIVDAALAALDALEAERDRYIAAHDGPTGSYARVRELEEALRVVDCFLANHSIRSAREVIRNALAKVA